VLKAAMPESLVYGSRLSTSRWKERSYNDTTLEYNMEGRNGVTHYLQYKTSLLPSLHWLLVPVTLGVFSKISGIGLEEFQENK